MIEVTFPGLTGYTSHYEPLSSSRHGARVGATFDFGVSGVRRAGVVHAWVGQILLSLKI